MTSKPSILSQLAELDRLGPVELKERWRALFGTEPPAYNRPFLIKRLAHRIQELAYGGLSESTRRQLRCMADISPTRSPQYTWVRWER